MMNVDAFHGLCSNCENETDFEIVTKEEVIPVRKEPVKLDVQYFRCKKCGDEFFDPKQNMDPFIFAYRLYRDKKALLQPEEIKAWRKTYKLTQKEMANLLGLGLATISRYENGSLQEESHDKLIRLAMDPTNLIKLIGDADEGFSQARKEQLRKILLETEANFHSLDNSILVNFGNYEPNELSGYKRFNLEKLYNAILFFCRKEVFLTKLNKLLFYADFKHFKEYTLSITGVRYAHIPFGPAPDNYQIYLGALNSKKQIEIIEDIDQTGGEIIRAIKEPDLSLFSASELRIMASVQEDFEDYRASVMTELSHKEAAYQDTQNGTYISYNYANQLNY